MVRCTYEQTDRRTDRQTDMAHVLRVYEKLFQARPNFTNT